MVRGIVFGAFAICRSSVELLAGDEERRSLTLLTPPAVIVLPNCEMTRLARPVPVPACPAKTFAFRGAFFWEFVSENIADNSRTQGHA